MLYNFSEHFSNTEEGYQIDSEFIGRLCEHFRPAYATQIPISQYEKVGNLILDKITERLKVASNYRFFQNMNSALSRTEYFQNNALDLSRYNKAFFDVLSGYLFTNDTFGLFEKIWGSSKESLQLAYIKELRIDIIKDLQYLCSRGLYATDVSSLPYFESYKQVSSYGKSVLDVLNFFRVNEFKPKEWRTCMAIRDRLKSLVAYTREVV